MKTKKNIFPNTILQIISAFLISIILTSPFVFFLNNYSQNVKSSLFLIAFFFIFILLIHLVNWKRKTTLHYNLKLQPLNILLPLLFLLLLFEIGISVPLSSYFTNLSSEELLNSSSLLIAIVIIAPITEEIIFRGIILKGLLTRYSSTKAIVISAIFFGLIHGKPVLIIHAFLIGLFLGWVYFKTKSVGVTIILHSATNLFVLGSLFFIQKIKSNTSPFSFNLYRIFLILVFSFLIFFFFNYFFVKHKRNIL